MKAKVNSKIVFFKYNEKDESFSISNDLINKELLSLISNIEVEA